MAIYSLNLKSVGKTTHAAGTAGAHALYIARDNAKPELAAEHMPTDPTEARTWLDTAERADRKNARVIDKIRIALPRELNSEQRMKLVQEFAQDLTGGRVAWFAAIHATGKDRGNPHAHIIVRDRDIDTGRRVLRLSDSARDRKAAGLEPKAVEWVRERWEHQANRALDRAGVEARIDRRTLEAQGVDRMPTIHIGPRAAHIEAHVQKPDSKKRITGNGRVINYPEIDQGRTRREHQAEIIDFNLERAARSPDFLLRERARFEREQRAKDHALERRLAREARALTALERQARAAMKAEMTELREHRGSVLKDARRMLRHDWQARRQAMTKQHQQERAELAKRQRSIGASLMRRIDITGRTRVRHATDRAALQERQKADRAELVAGHRERRDAAHGLIQQRCAGLKDDIRTKHRPRLVELRHQQIEAERVADRHRQERATERTQAEERHEEALRQAISQARRRQGEPKTAKSEFSEQNAPQTEARKPSEIRRQRKERNQYRGPDRSR